MPPRPKPEPSTSALSFDPGVWCGLWEMKMSLLSPLYSHTSLHDQTTVAVGLMAVGLTGLFLHGESAYR